MALKMVPCLVVAMSALIVVASATVTFSDNVVRPDGIGECLKDLPKLSICGKKTVPEFFTEGKFAITQGCCEAIGAAIIDCFEIVLKQFGITADQLSLLLGFCKLIPDGPAPAPAAL